MSDVKNAVDQIVEFINNEKDKTLLLRGIADKEKHQALLKALNDQGEMTGVIKLIHTTKHGMEEFFRWAELYKVKPPKRYEQVMKFSNLTIFFDNLTTKTMNKKYDDHALDFIIVWPIVSVTKNIEEIRMLKDMADRQKTKKIIYLTIKEPWCNPDIMESIVDRVIKLDCENDDSEEYNRILVAFEEDLKRCGKIRMPDSCQEQFKKGKSQ